jgi:hypothetical protein
MFSEGQRLKALKIKISIKEFGIILAWAFLFIGILYVLRFEISKIFLPSPQRAFYYWKTKWDFSPQLESQLKENQITRLYVRFFDVDWDSYQSRSHPVAPIQISNIIPQQLEVVPVIYITNSVFQWTHFADVEDLGKKIWNKIQLIAEKQKINVKEIQIDCDWTDKTKKNYFHFIDRLKNNVLPKNLKVSTTIRLHQIKYASRTGVPPSDGGMLMFYNFGRIKAESLNNSIFNREDAAKYSRYIANYSLPLAVVLPIFSWMIHSRDQKVINLLEWQDPQELSQVGFRESSANVFEATHSFFYHGSYFSQGDKLTIEQISPKNTKEAAQLAQNGSSWKKRYKTVAFFDLDERNLRNYEKNEIESIFNKF